MGFIDNSALDRASNWRAHLNLPAVQPEIERQIVWTHIEGNPQLRPPAYTFFVAGIYFVFGDNQIALRLIQLTIGLGSVLLGYWLGKRLLGSLAGILMAVGLAFYWPLILYEMVMHEPVLVVFVSLLFLNCAAWWAEQPRYGRAAILGMACGLYTTAAAAIILFLPILVCWCFWVLVRKAAYSVTKAAAQSGVVLVCFFIPLLPVAILNYAESGMFVLNSYGQGITLYIGNQPGAQGYLMPGDTLLDEYFGGPQPDLRIDERVARIDSWPRWAALSRKAALDYIRSNPGWFLALCVRRALLFWSPHEISQNVIEHAERLNSPVLRRIPGNFGVVVLLWVMGLIAYGKWCLWEIKRGRDGNLLLTHSEGRAGFYVFTLMLLLIITWYAPYTVLWVSSHFRIPLLPSLFAFGVLGLSCIRRAIIARQWKMAAVLLVFPAALAPVMMLVPAHYDKQIEQWVYFHSRYYVDRGQPDRAASHIRPLVEHVPNHAFSQMTYGNLLLQLDEKQQALHHFERALEFDTGTIDRCTTVLNIALLHKEVGSRDASEAHFRSVLECEPHNEVALNAVSQFAFDRGDYKNAIRYLKKVQQVAPEKSNPYFLMGLSHLALGSRQAAERAFREGLAVDAEDIWITLALADLLLANEETDEACRLYERAAGIDPDNEQAMRALAAACH